MNFKRGRPKNARAGCLLCQPHKANGCTSRPVSERRKTVDPIDVHEAVAFERETRDQDWDDDRLRCSYCGGPCEELYGTDWDDPYCPPPIPLTASFLEVVAFR